MEIPMTELIGYVASVLVAVSLMMSSIVKLRIINFIGSVIFTIYGIIINAYPVALVNGFIAIVNIYYLAEIFSRKEYFDILEVKHDSDFLGYFLKFHEKEIKKYIPTFSFDPQPDWTIIFVLRNSVPAGLVCAEYLPGDALLVKLDYVIPGYRDFKVGRFVFQNYFKKKNIKRIISEPGNKAHQKYLKKMGFVETTEGKYELIMQD
ncbi:MAG: hypothetical protein ACOYVE_01670 [Melioribacter sp.]|uniref:hypothetical protein n=1 Tax=Melioribacter sp. TaxID=2052167 RepID=UPI003BBA7D3D